MDSVEWVKQQLCEDGSLTNNKLSERASKQGVMFYPSIATTARKDLGIKPHVGRPRKIGLGMTTAAKAVQAKMAKTLPANTNAGFDDAIAVMKLAQSIGGYGVLYDVVDKFKKAGF